MTKTKIKKIVAAISLFSILSVSLNVQAATQIGTGSVVGSGALDTAIMWDDQFPWTASGTIDGIVVTATVLPILNMIVSADSIDLGTLSNVSYSTGSVDLEVGTNASNGVTISARSTNSGLSSSANGSVINNLSTDGVQESYKFISALNAVADSSVWGYTQTANLDTEVSDTTDYTVYNTNKPEASDGVNDVTLSVAAQIDTQTPAGNDYTDTVVITVTWNF